MKLHALKNIKDYGIIHRLVSLPHITKLIFI